MVLRFPSCSPRRSGLLSPSPARRDGRAVIANRQLDASVEASGPHDFAVRDQRTRLLRLSRPPLPAPNVGDDRPNAPLDRARDARTCAADLPDGSMLPPAANW